MGSLVKEQINDSSIKLVKIQDSSQEAEKPCRKTKVKLRVGCAGEGIPNVPLIALLQGN